MRGILVCHPESEPQKKIAMDTEQRPIPHPSVSYGGSSASGARPSITTSIDQNTGTSDVTRRVRTGPTQDVTRTSSKDHIGGEVAMREDENSGGHPSPAEPDCRRRITTKRAPREVRDEQASTNEQHVPRRISGKRPTRAQLLSPRKRHWTDTVQNDTLKCVSISSAGSLEVTHCDFSGRSARDEMRHIIGSSEPDVIIGSDKDQNRRCRTKDKDHMAFLRWPAVATSCMS